MVLIFQIFDMSAGFQNYLLGNNFKQKTQLHILNDPLWKLKSNKLENLRTTYTVQNSNEIFSRVEGRYTVRTTTDPSSPLIKLDASFKRIPAVFTESIMRI